MQNTIIRGFSNSNQLEIKFNFREIEIKTYFLVKLTFAYHECVV